ncbi:MAG: hypothetical protein M0C28_25495 [Candidatus Moduliflexus flocculans]|nr:hypothetical protein [Candidatus Moduliflexus flocculans]
MAIVEDEQRGPGGPPLPPGPGRAHPGGGLLRPGRGAPGLDRGQSRAGHRPHGHPPARA